MIGGRNGPELSDTWEYISANSTWLKINTTNQPELAFFGAVYDSTNDKILTFGGLEKGAPI